MCTNALNNTLSYTHVNFVRGVKSPTACGTLVLKK